MLVARAQLDFVRDLVGQFERYDSVMRPIVDRQSQYIAIVALLRFIGHSFRKVDCAEEPRRSWAKATWPEWQRDPIFSEFIEPARNDLLKEFQGGLAIQSEAFDSHAVVADPASPSLATMVASFDASKVRAADGRPVLPLFHRALAFWDRRLAQAETEWANRS